jgi:predicted dinucleotide-binding enzyme
MTRLGFIGVGSIGGALVRAYRALGHESRVANSRGPASLKELSDETGAIASTIEEVILNSDIIFISLPQSAISGLPKELIANLPSEVIVVDVGSYFPVRDGAIKEIDDGKVHSIWVSEQLGRPDLLKAFNNIGGPTVAVKAKPAGDANRVALPIYGDNAEHKKILLELIESIGYDAVDGGALSESWRQQPGTAAFCTDYDRATLIQVLHDAVKSEGRTRCDVFFTKVPEMYAYAGVNGDDTAAWMRTFWALPYESILAQHALLPKA